MPANNYFDSLFSKNHVDLNRPRSSFPRERKVYTSLDAGKLVPIAFEEVLPGDTVTRRTRQLWRLTTPKFPTMDHAFLDVYNFFIPYRILQTNFKRVFGEAETPWISSQDYVIPQITFTRTFPGVNDFSVGDYFGLPTAKQIIDVNASGAVKYGVNALYGRGYAMTFNEYFRDVNLMPAAFCPLDDTDRVFQNVVGSDPFASAYAYGPLLPVAKVHDYFTSALPCGPQRGEDVSINLGGQALVKTGDPADFTQINFAQGLRFYSNAASDYQNRFLLPNVTADDGNTYSVLGKKESTSENGRHSIYTVRGSITSASSSSINKDQTYGSNLQVMIPANLYADLSSVAATTINELRMAIATQQYLELLARGGNRYRSFLFSFFGVTSPDASLQIPQYLSGKRIPIKISQVIQNSSDNEVTQQPLGETGAYSLTYEENFDFSSSFTEYGFILTLACLRTTHTYTQGLHKAWSRRSALDFYTPVFANVGEMPIDKKEIVMTGDPDRDNQVFGYQEAYAEYRYSPNTGTARFRAGTDVGTYLPWTYIDDYSSVPSLSSAWITEPKDLLNRSLVVNSEEAGQLFGEVHFDDTWRRVMPVYSIPGLYRL